jgi:hypothetical protein
MGCLSLVVNKKRVKQNSEIEGPEQESHKDRLRVGPELCNSISNKVANDEVNARCIARLKDASLSERVVVVGSGPSMILVPSVEELKKRLCKECGIRERKAVAVRCANILDHGIRE